MARAHPPRSDGDRPAEPSDDDADFSGSAESRAKSSPDGSDDPAAKRSRPNYSDATKDGRAQSGSGDADSISRRWRAGSDDSRDWPGRALLGRRNAREVISRLTDGDPLEIRARCIARIEHHARFIDVRRLQLRAVARIAHAAPRYSGEPALDPWLEERIDAAIEDLLNEDAEEDRSDIPATEPWDPRYAFVSETLGIEPALARRACIAFNDLPTDVRRAYFATVVAKKTIHRYVAEGNGPPEKVKGQLQRVLDAIRAAIEPREGDGGKGGS